MSKGHYVCQRAAHAIIAEIGPLRVSSDALGAINLFIDEFLALLIMSATSLDLVRLKTAVVQLLPHSLGKNALVEAEIELKHQVESEQHDFTSYEKMRSLGGNNNFPVDQVVPLLQIACADYCTLAADDDNSSVAPSIVKNGTIIIAPVVVIYVTTIVEHIAEYVLNSVAMTADQADAEHIRVKEVLLTLLDDPQVSMLFRRMNLKEKLEKRASTYPSYYNNLPTPAPSPVSLKRDKLVQRNSHTSTHHKDDPDISFNEFIEGDDNEPRATPSSNCSMRSSESINDRPLSIMSNGTVKSSGSKSRFNFFGSKEKRHSISLNFSSSKRSPSSAMTSPTTPSFSQQSMASPTSNDFDDLIRSGNTKKVTLTPNRLRSIEVKEENNVTPWERFTTTTSSKGSRTKKRSTELPASPPPPIPPLPRLNRDIHNHHQSTTANNDSSPPLTPASSVASRPSQRSRHSIIYEEKSITSKSSMKSYSTNEDLLVDETTNLMRNPSKISTSSSLYSSESKASSTTNAKPRFERPSSMVVKRASMGSRPPSFHENVLTMDSGHILMAAAAGSVVEPTTTSKTFDDLRQQYENRKSVIIKKMANHHISSATYDEEQQESTTFEHQHQQPADMIYVIPSSTISRSPINGGGRIMLNNKPRTVDRGCQTDPIALHTLIQQHHHHHIQEETEEEEDNDNEEEWFIEEEEWEDHAEEERFVVEWLLGNV